MVPCWLFTAGITLLTSVIFGLVPALRASSPNLNEFMKEGRRTTASGSHQAVARRAGGGGNSLGLMLLVVAGLLLRSFHRLIVGRSWLESAQRAHVEF